MLDGFETRRIITQGAQIHTRIGGSGPPLLLLHGFPQTHAMWHRVAPRLAERFTLVMTDLRGYGNSSKPGGGGDHATYSKRSMAQDQIDVMDALGHKRFFLAGHDRGGRVAHRLILDHPGRVERASILDIAPTLAMYRQADKEFATAYYHWFFLIQPYDLPERLIGAEPDFFLDWTLGALSGGFESFAPEAISEYKRCFRDRATIHAACEDYRAAAGIDLHHDESDLSSKIDIPLQILWGAKGVVGKIYDVLALWRERATQVSGMALESGHFLPEEAPEATASALLNHFA